MDTTGTIFMPPESSTIAGEVDAAFYFIYWASIVLFAIVVGFAALFVLKYRRKKRELTSGVAHNTKLEVAWTLIPTILIVIVFVMGFKGFIKMNVIPKDALEIKVTGQKWFWTFDYPEGVNTVNELVVPVDKAVALTMSSQDVIHSFFVPNFRIKMDVLPNRYSMTWFEATRPGVYDLFCTEFCGKGHSEMIGKVRVVNDREYEEWLEEAAFGGEGMSLEDYGAKLYVSKACVTCHSIDGRIGTGPTFAKVYGHSVRLADGREVMADENYIRKSILEPASEVVAGFQSVMPTYQGILKDREIDALVAFIKSLKDKEGP